MSDQYRPENRILPGCCRRSHKPDLPMNVRDVARQMADKRGWRIETLLDGLRIRGIMQGLTIPRRHDYARSEAVSTSAMKDFIAAKTEGWHEA